VLLPDDHSPNGYPALSKPRSVGRLAACLPSDSYRSLLSFRLQRLRRHAREVLRLEKTGNGDIFVNGFPVNTDAPADEFPLISLLTSGREQAGKPGKGRRNRATIR